MAIALEGKVAIVTGATSGIGRAIAVALAKAKVKLVLAARRIGEGENVAKEIQAAGGTALFGLVGRKRLPKRFYGCVPRPPAT